MNQVEPRHSGEEFKEWGNRIYEEKIRPKLTAEDHGKFVAIDVEGRGFEIAEEGMVAREALRRRVPDAQIWLKRVGFEAAYHIGWHGKPRQK